MKDPEFLDRIGRLLALVEGLEHGQITCPCRRVYRLGVTAELKELLPLLRREHIRRTNASAEESLPETSRFALLEVD